MDIIIGFFRDFLDGPVYIIVCIISFILICSCIGYLAEKSLEKKKNKIPATQVETVNTTGAPVMMGTPQVETASPTVANVGPQTEVVSSVVPTVSPQGQQPPQQ